MLIYDYMFADTHIHTYAHIYIYICIMHIHTYIHVYIQLYVYLYVHIIYVTIYIYNALAIKHSSGKPAWSTENSYANGCFSMAVLDCPRL